MRPRLALVMFLASLAALAAAARAQAAFPGANGKLAFVRTENCDPDTGVCDRNLYLINPDGSGQTGPLYSRGVTPAWSPDGTKIALTGVDNPSHTYDIVVTSANGGGTVNLTNSNPADEQYPAWSPDGSKIAFGSHPNNNPFAYGEIDVMNADGSGRSSLTSSAFFDDEPDWSPDGAKLAFVSYYRDNDYDIYTMNQDGSGVSRLTTTPKFDYEPSWSPDGSKIVFLSARDSPLSCVSNSIGDCSFEIYVMNADGSGQTNLTHSLDAYGYPVWSPDGTKIAFNKYTAGSGWHIWVMDADGTNRTQITSSPNPDGQVDWQRVSTANYERPQSAPSLTTSLVPVSEQCGTSGNPVNAHHAPPLSVGSCSPPSPSSAVVHIGPQMQGSAALRVTPGDTDPTNGNQANVAISASLTDIQAAAGDDYNPNASGADLTAVTRLRFTDKANGYGGLPATASEYDFGVPIDCTSTANPKVGSTCTANTTANALLPSLIQEQRQAVVQAFRVRVDDSGANGIRGDSDDRIFATQGVFVP